MGGCPLPSRAHVPSLPPFFTHDGGIRAGPRTDRLLRVEFEAKDEKGGPVHSGGSRGGFRPRLTRWLAGLAGHAVEGGGCCCRVVKSRFSESRARFIDHSQACDVSAWARAAGCGSSSNSKSGVLLLPSVEVVACAQVTDSSTGL